MKRLRVDLSRLHEVFSSLDRWALQFKDGKAIQWNG